MLKKVCFDKKTREIQFVRPKTSQFKIIGSFESIYHIFD